MVLMSWKDSVTNNTRIGEVLDMNIKSEKEAFQKDKMAIIYLIEESVILEDIAHADGNGTIRKNKGGSNTSIIKATQNPRYKNSNYNMHYSRYKANERNNRYKNDTHVENNYKTIISTKSLT